MNLTIHILLTFIFYLATCSYAYLIKHIIPKSLRVKLCEQNPTLSICESLFDDSQNTIPADLHSKWDICASRPDLMLCRIIPYKNFKLSQFPIKSTSMTPMPEYVPDDIIEEGSGQDEAISQQTTPGKIKNFAAHKDLQKSIPFVPSLMPKLQPLDQ